MKRRLYQLKSKKSNKRLNSKDTDSFNSSNSGIIKPDKMNTVREVEEIVLKKIPKKLKLKGLQQFRESNLNNVVH